MQVLAEQIIEQSKKQSDIRYLVAIAGPPASGKSTFAEQLCTLINKQIGFDICDIVPMDGFHLDNTELDKLKLRHRKGAANTFDSNGFVNLIKSLQRSDESINIPLFDRNADATIHDAKTISSKHRILIIEGNYLLLDCDPWSQLHETYNFRVFLQPDIHIIKKRLIKRWLDNGNNLDGAKQRAFSNDIPNAEFVLQHSIEADLVI